jgi:hypothetical protein
MQNKPDIRNQHNKNTPKSLFFILNISYQKFFSVEKQREILRKKKLRKSAKLLMKNILR